MEENACMLHYIYDKLMLNTRDHDSVVIGTSTWHANVMGSKLGLTYLETWLSTLGTVYPVTHRSG